MTQPRPETTATRERILAAAGHVFARKGYMAASLDEVAQAAGMTKGAIYWHFRSKSDLFFALLDFKFQLNIAPVPDDLRVAAAAAVSDPRLALTWLVNELSELGVTLKAGEIVTTGTCIVPLPIAPGDLVRADFGLLGEVSVHIV